MKKIIIALFALACLAVVGVLVLVMTFDVNQYKPEIIELVKSNTGRDFRIDGELSIEPSLIPTIVVEGVYFGNASWAAQKEMLRVERFEAVAELMPLLKKQLSIKKIILKRPTVYLEKNDKGKGNWELSVAESETEKSDGGDVPALAVEQISITDATLHYREAGKDPQTYRLKHLSLGGKPSAAQLSLDMEMLANDLPAKLKGKIGSPYYWLDNKPYSVDLKGSFGALQADIKASIQQPKDLKGIHIELDAQTAATQQLTELAGLSLAELGEVSLQAVLDDTGKAWTAEHIGMKFDISGSVSDLQLSSQGQVGHLQEAREVSVKFKLDAGSTELLQRITEQEMPDIGSFSLEGSLADTGQGVDSKNPGVKLDVKGGFADVSLSIAGLIGQLKQMQDVDILLSLTADSTENLAMLTQQDLQPAGPLAFKGQVIEQGGTWQTRDMTFKLGRSDVAGQIKVNLTGEIPAVQGQITSNQLDLTEFLPPPEAPAEEKQKPKADKVFSSEPLALDGLKQANVKLTLQAGLLRTHQADFKDLNLALDLEKGDLQVTNLRAGILGGTMSGSASVSANRPDVKLSFKLAGIEPTQLAAVRETKEIEGARTDLDLQITGRGVSVAEIAGSANGSLKIKVGEGKLPNKGLSLAGGDFLMGTLSALNPLSKKDPATLMECAAVNFSIKEGLASNDKAFALQTQKLNILGGGQVNLKTEELDIGASPKPREGIGLNLSGVAGAVRLGGTLANPSPKADAGGVAKSAAKVGAAIATGGISLLAEGLFDRATVDDTICEQVLTQAKSTSQAAPAESKPAEKPASKVEEVKEKISAPLDDVGSAVKGLFGQ